MGFRVERAAPVIYQNLARFLIKELTNSRDIPGGPEVKNQCWEGPIRGCLPLGRYGGICKPTNLVDFCSWCCGLFRVERHSDRGLLERSECSEEERGELLLSSLDNNSASFGLPLFSLACQFTF